MDVAAKLRQPKNYGLMKLLMHVLFGVTPGQRVQPLTEEAGDVARETMGIVGKAAKKSPAGVLAGVGLVASVGAFLLNVLRGRK
jgi:hypothetical protein